MRSDFWFNRKVTPVKDGLEEGLGMIPSFKQKHNIKKRKSSRKHARNQELEKKFF